MHCICIAAHSAQRVAIRFPNNMSMTVFQLFPNRSDTGTVNAVRRCWQAAKSIRNKSIRYAL